MYLYSMLLLMDNSEKDKHIKEHNTEGNINVKIHVKIQQ